MTAAEYYNILLLLRKHIPPTINDFMPEDELLLKLHKGYENEFWEQVIKNEEKAHRHVHGYSSMLRHDADLRELLENMLRFDPSIRWNFR
jgi:hypothetical protein